MRPDDIRVGIDEQPDGSVIPIPADLRSLDAELEESGVRARRMLHGRTQPTNYFVMDLRARLLHAYLGELQAGGATLDVMVPRSLVPEPKASAVSRHTETSPITPPAPRIDLLAPSTLPDARRAFLAAALAAGLLIAGALGMGAIPR